MSELTSDRKIFSLFEITRSIQKTISERYKSSYWITAEMNKLNHYPQSGHCYPELVEKQDGKIIAQIRCNLWKDDYQKINLTFQRVINEPLKDGIKILFQATIAFHPIYGLSLRILNIDPSYTLGDIEKEKQDTIKRLREEGIFNNNKKLKLPIVPQRIALISVQTSKGYSDALRVFESANKSWGYKFFYMLFPSLLQGDKAIHSIIQQLKNIKRVIEHFDTVAIIRGGGGDIGLSCYNNYELAKEIALFPIPVITGIGHSTNETVAEMVAFANTITPTKFAEYLIQQFHNFSVPVKKAKENVIDKTKRLIHDQRIKFQTEVKLFDSIIRNTLIKSENEITQQVQSLSQQSVFRLKNEKENLVSLRETVNKETSLRYTSEKLSLIEFVMSLRKDSMACFNQLSLILDSTEKNIINMSPKNVMKRGYSITLLGDKSVSSFKQVKEGELLSTLVYEGTIKSVVQSSNKPSNNE